MSLTIQPGFAVPFAHARLAGADALNAALARLILSLEQQGDAHRNTTALVHQPDGLFESDFEFFARPEPEVAELRTFCWSALNELIRSVNAAFDGATRPQLRIASHTWFHVTRTGGYFGYHNHPMASWSGVYCVASEPRPGVTNDGALVFPSPLPGANAYMDVANSTLKWPYSHGNYAIDLVPGQLVLFPSWLSHYVTPYGGSSPRITVAFNAWFAADPA